MPRILCLDPGESTGWFMYSGPIPCSSPAAEGDISMGTVRKYHLDLAKLFDATQPDLVIFETFNLYPGSAKSLTWNSFYPCEVIGIIKFICMQRCIEIIAQSPAVKGYSGGLDDSWIQWKKEKKYEATEHTKDAYLHFKYYNKKMKKP